MTMEKNIVKENEKLKVEVKGRIDTNTAPELETVLPELDGIKELIVDLKEVDYISSSGLRVLIAMFNTMEEQGTMKIINVCDIVMDIFEATGLNEIFDLSE